jgi:hypothetical protein
MSTHAQARTRTRTLLIVTAAQREAANAVAVQVAGPYAQNTFSVPYYAGQVQSAKPTHYVACWDMPDVQVSEFRKRMAAEIGGKSVEAIAIADRASPRDQLKAKAISPSKG